MLWRFQHRQHRREADVAAFHDVAPVVAGLGFEHRGQFLLEARPLGGVHLRAELVGVHAGLFHQFGVELRFDGADADVFVVLGLVGVVEVCAAIEHVRAALVLEAVADHGEEHRHQRRRAVHHRRVDDLALARARRFQHPAHQAVGQQHAAAAEIADEIQRRHRLAARFADGVQGAGKADVVDVVAGGVGDGAVLPPAGHAPVDELFVARHTVVRPKAQAFGDARAKALEQGIGGFHQLQHQFHAFRLLQIHGDGTAVARQHVAPATAAPNAIHADHLGAHVGQHHAAERPRPDARQLDNAKAL